MNNISDDGLSDSALAVLAAAVGGHPLLVLGGPEPAGHAHARGLAQMLGQFQRPAPLVCVPGEATARELTGFPRPAPDAPGGPLVRLRGGLMTAADGGVLHLPEADGMGPEVLGILGDAHRAGQVAFEVHGPRRTLWRPTRFHLVAGAAPGGKDQHPAAAAPARLWYYAQIRLVNPGAPELDEHAMSAVVSARRRSRRRMAAGRGGRWHACAPLWGIPWDSGDWALAPEGIALVPTLERLARAGLLSQFLGPARVIALAWSLADLRGIARPGRRELVDAVRLHRPDLSDLVEA